ncbi:MAG: diguanylate cyclase [Firmicutes bacterium]|nr:diguanylate cyclase [Bacillota bacterium]
METGRQRRDLKGAIHLAECVCESVKELNIKHPHSSWNRLTVSCGVACMYPNNSQDTQMALITSADMALYEAKRAGGNKYMWAKSQNGQRILINTKN